MRTWLFYLGKIAMQTASLPSTEQTDSTKAYFSSRLQPDPARERLWQVLCRYLQPEVPGNGKVLELGGGYCNFINNIRAAEKHVLDLHENIREFAGYEVHTHVQSCTRLQQFPAGYFDVVFASNLFEHLRREELRATLFEVHRVLADAGKLIIIQPNFRYCYKSYFDDYTHVEIYTHVSLGDVLLAHGFCVQRMVPRFLPFSLKARAPKWPWLLRLYLALPWRPFAGQMFAVATKERRPEPQS